MRTHNEIFKDLQKYSKQLISCKKEEYQAVLIQYNIILKEFDNYYEIYCSKCDKQHSQCNCKKDNLMDNSSS